MATQTRTPVTITDDSAVGTVAWSNPSNAGASDDSYATAVLGSSAQSHYLKALNCGFSVTSDPTQCDVNFERHCGTATFVTDVIVRLVVGGSVVGADKSLGAAWPASDTVKTFTWSSAELAAAGATMAAVNASDFGVVIACLADPADTAYIDATEITLTYTPPSVLFRKTLSPVGTRTGNRQRHGWGQ